MNKINKRYIALSGIAIGALITLILFLNLISSLVQYRQATKEYTQLKEEAVTTTESSTKPLTIYQGTATAEIVQSINKDAVTYALPDITVDFNSLIAANSDCIGWIYIPGTRINYPIVKSSDNIDYVKSTFTGKENLAGCIFSDCRVLSPFSQKTLLYGHNMKNGSMFHDLFAIEMEPSKYPDVWVYLTNGALYHYAITDVIRTDMLDKDIYSISANYSDELVLSTCIKNETRLVVKAVRDWYKF